MSSSRSSAHCSAALSSAKKTARRSYRCGTSARWHARDEAVIPLRVGAALGQPTQNGALCVGGENGLRGSRNYSSSCQPGRLSVCRRAKAGRGLLW
eukprot:351787-Chlamydomonas_euryale.AAC.3